MQQATRLRLILTPRTDGIETPSLSDVEIKCCLLPGIYYTLIILSLEPIYKTLLIASNIFAVMNQINCIFEQK